MSRYFDRDLHTTAGGEGLPPFPNPTVGALVEESDASDDVYLFACVECGHREANPPAPLTGCGCGGDVVCHTFHYTEYNRIRQFGDPRAGEGYDDPREVAVDGGGSA